MISIGLKKLDKKGISLWNKEVRNYEKASKDYSKQKVLMKLYDQNPTLKLFVEKLVVLNENE
jgi:hypothetical protein